MRTRGHTVAQVRPGLWQVRYCGQVITGATAGEAIDKALALKGCAKGHDPAYLNQGECLYCLAHDAFDSGLEAGRRLAQYDDLEY
jgi:hypothetical protein